MSVMVLNASYEPLGGVVFKQALRMLYRGVAVVHESLGDKTVGPYPWPTVLRLVRYVKTTWLYQPARFSRRGVLLRDRHVCAFCGAHATTVDHIRPRSRGGTNTWLNVVACCADCNSVKADRTPFEAGMKRLHCTPYAPRIVDLREWESAARAG